MLTKDISTNSKHLVNNENLNQNTKEGSYGCLVGTIIFWLLVDIVIGASQIALGAWIRTQVKDTIILSSVLIALG